jgi:hypothetical protein
MWAELSDDDEKRVPQGFSDVGLLMKVLHPHFLCTPKVPVFDAMVAEVPIFIIVVRVFVIELDGSCA